MLRYVLVILVERLIIVIIFFRIIVTLSSIWQFHNHELVLFFKLVKNLLVQYLIFLNLVNSYDLVLFNLRCWHHYWLFNWCHFWDWILLFHRRNFLYLLFKWWWLNWRFYSNAVYLLCFVITFIVDIEGSSLHGNQLFFLLIVLFIINRSLVRNVRYTVSKFYRLRQLRFLFSLSISIFFGKYCLIQRRAMNVFFFYHLYV